MLYLLLCRKQNFSCLFVAKLLSLAAHPFIPPVYSQIYLFDFTIKVFLTKICVFTPPVRCEILIFSSFYGCVLLKAKISKQIQFQFPKINSCATSKMNV